MPFFELRMQLQSLLLSHFAIISLFISTFLPHLRSQNITSDYDLCSPFKCGHNSFTFPFSVVDSAGSGPTSCGLPGYQFTCSDDQSSRIILSGRFFLVKDLYLSDHLITVVDIEFVNQLRSDPCASLNNLTMSGYYNISPLSFPPGTSNLTFISCPSEFTPSGEFLAKVITNYTCNDAAKLYLWDYGSPKNPPQFSPVQTPYGCKSVTVPVSRYRFLNRSAVESDRWTEVVDMVADGLPLTWTIPPDCVTCNSTGGRCGFDGNLKSIACFHKLGSSKKNGKNLGLIIGVSIGSCLILLLVVLLALAFRRRILPTLKMKKNQTIDEDKEKVDQFVKTYQSALVTKYSYSDIKKMTNGFTEKLGEGGYGNVYKGRLQSDGRLVAVKLLENSNSNGSDFVNEVATIGMIHHVNVIRLLGFSWNGSKQAVIYEYMPNGSLGDLLSNERLRFSLGSQRMLEIAIGIAHGIEYLHYGCESRILHLDIKPQNVLLDENFNPKISDFGLAKMYSRSRSAVTMTGVRGTIGYIAPEIFMRNLGKPSRKSDVYSYGMLLIEMVGGKKPAEAEPNLISSSSEAYFPDWIYEKLIEGFQWNSGDEADMVVVEDDCILKKMVMVGLWCIQIDPKNRPSMTRVVEMLTGNADVIEMPPKPFFSFPPHDSQHHIDIASFESDSTALHLNSDSHEMHNSINQ